MFTDRHNGPPFADQFERKFDRFHASDSFNALIRKHTTRYLPHRFHWLDILRIDGMCRAKCLRKGEAIIVNINHNHFRAEKRLDNDIPKPNRSRPDDADEISALGVNPLANAIRHTKTVPSQKHTDIMRHIVRQLEADMVRRSDAFSVCPWTPAAVVAKGIFPNRAPSAIPTPPNGVDTDAITDRKSR
jgi:hypothetical protein